MKAAFLALVEERLLYGGAWLIGFEVSRHGLCGGAPHTRIVDLPICEETGFGLAIGLQRVGAEVFIDIMFDTFVLRGLDVLVNQVAVSKLMDPAPTGRVIVRALAGPFEGGGPQHGGTMIAMLARLPHIEVAVPVHDDDIGTAAAAFGATVAPSFLILPAAPSMDGGGQVEGHGRGQLRQFGMGSDLCVIVLGPFLHLVLAAVCDIGAAESITVIAPLFVAPLPVAALAASGANCARILIVDAASPPAGLASELLGAFARYAVDTVVAIPDPTVERYQTHFQVAAFAAVLRATLAARSVIS